MMQATHLIVEFIYPRQCPAVTVYLILVSIFFVDYHAREVVLYDDRLACLSPGLAFNARSSFALDSKGRRN